MNIPVWRRTRLRRLLLKGCGECRRKIPGILGRSSWAFNRFGSQLVVRLLPDYRIVNLDRTGDHHSPAAVDFIPTDLASDRSVGRAIDRIEMVHGAPPPPHPRYRMRPALRWRSVTVRYGPVRAVDGLDLFVGDGETVAVLGPSGSGKSTLMYAVAGFQPVDEGSIEIDGAEVSAPGATVPPERRPVGLVFQSYALWPHLTAEETVAYPMPDLV